MPVTCNGQQYVNTEELAAVRGIATSTVYRQSAQGRYGVPYVYGAGLMRPRTSEDGRKETWFLKSEVDNFTPEKPGPKPLKTRG